MDRVEEIRTIIIEVLKEGPMPGNVLTRKIIERNKHVLDYDPCDLMRALYLSYTEGSIERVEENHVINYRINGSEK